MKKTLLALSLFATTAFAEPVTGIGQQYCQQICK